MRLHPHDQPCADATPDGLSSGLASGLASRMGLAFGLAMSLWVMLVLVSTAWANPFLPGSALCAEPMERWQGESTAADPLVIEDCADGGLDDPAFNVCFEGAEVPISTLPQLLAEAHAERLAREIADAVGAEPRPVELAEAAEADGLLTSRADDADQVAIAPRIPRPRPPQLACSSYPEECNALPTIPQIELAGASAPAAHPEGAPFLAPAHTLQLPEPSPWAHHGAGPADEHRAPPETPPRA